MASQDWVARIADAVEGDVPSGAITVASGISPSGGIHMGNLREIITSHFVADELAKRGREVKHIHSWDDYDRFRKVPAGIPGVDASWQEHIGKPLSEVPAPPGSGFLSWAEHFKSELIEALGVLGIQVDAVSQSERYRAGAYLEQIVHAMDSRERIAEILGGFKTKGEALDPSAYYPFKPYCHACGKDFTTVTEWDSSARVISYECTCGANQSAAISEVSGKLVWKVDWPMRWAYEGVNFEPAGVDHMSPGSSWDVGKAVVGVFDGTAPRGQRYSFVGFNGMAKMASSTGGSPTPKQVLQVLPPEIIRWLYARALPTQAFNVDIEGGISRLYDEWDAFSKKVNEGRAKDGDEAIYHRSVSTFFGQVSPTLDSQVGDIKFRALASFADISVGSAGEMVALMREISDVPLNMARAARAVAWVENYMPAGERILKNSALRSDFLGKLSEEQRSAVRTLAQGLDAHWVGQGLTRWSFGAAKVTLGIDIDERNLSPEARAFQRDYFTNVYQLLISRDAGPRLPQLLRSIGLEKAKELLGE